MEIKGDIYRVTCDDQKTVVFEGTLRLRAAMDYEPIRKLLDEVTGKNPAVVTLDLRDLTFLNSAGINMLLEFALKARDQTTGQVVILGATDIPWQTRSLPNMEKLTSRVTVEME